MYKHTTIALVGVLAASLIMMAVVTSSDQALAKKPSKATQCNNVKVHVRVNGVQANDTVVATVQIGLSAKTKSGVVEENLTDITIPINFNKINPCPPVGSQYFGNVNGTGFTGTLKSLQKPNLVIVDMGKGSESNSNTNQTNSTS